MTRPTGRSVVAWVLIALGFVYAIFIGGAPAGTQLPELRLFTAAITATAMAVWAVVAWRQPDWRPRSFFLPAFAACLLSMAISTVTSKSPRISVEYLAYAVALVALYLLLVRLVSQPFFRQRLVSLAALCGILIAGIFVAAVVSEWVRFWGLVGHVTTPPLRPSFESLVYGNPAPVLVMVVLLGGVAIGWIVGWRRGRFVAGAALVILCGAAVLATGARGGWFGIGVATLTVMVLAAVRGDTRRQVVATARSALAGRGRVAAVGGAAALALIAFVVVPGLIRRLTAGGEEVRATFYEIALRIFGEAPLTGAGPGIWAVQRIAHTEPTELDLYVPHAHDLYLQGLAEMGIVGLVPGMLVAVSLIWLLRDGLRDPSAERRRWAWVGVFTTAYFASHQLVDFYANMPATLVAFAMPIAILDATSSHGPRWTRPGWLAIDTRLKTVVGSVVLVGSLATMALVEIPALRHAEAVRLANEGRWASAYPVAQEAADMDTDMPIYALTAGLAAARASDHGAAMDRFTRIAEAGDLPEAWLDLAASHLAAGNTASARSALGEALRLGSQRVAVAVPAADLAIRLGEPEAARAVITRALAIAPNLAADPWWRADPARSEALGEAITVARAAGGPAFGWQVELFLGNLEAARGDAAALSQPSRQTAEDVIAAWDGDSGARASLTTRCENGPLDEVVIWCVRVASKFHTADEARFRDWARIVGWDDLQLGEVMVVTDPATFAVGTDSAYLYGLQVYRRFVPWDILAPSLVHLKMR